MKPDSEGLHPIANTDKPNREADIVFVHGLRGASHATWRYSLPEEEDHFFWPEELGKDLPTCGIWSVGYPAGFTALGKPGMDIEKRAGNLSLKLANTGVGTRTLFFITHSLGGLIVKSLVVDSQTQADSDRKRLVSKIAGIVFCATPHKGSGFADAAGVLGKLFGGSQSHVDQMRANADQLDLLHEQFIEWHRHSMVPVQSYAENVGLFRTRPFLRPLPLGVVVPRASANPGIAGHSVRDVDDDHLTLVKPSNRLHDVYKGVLRFIQDELAPSTLDFDTSLLALLNLAKQRCKERDVAFFTPNLLSTLLSIRGGVPERALAEAAGSKLATEIRDALLSYSPPVDRGSPPAFTDFTWESREDVRTGQQLAHEEGSKVVTARHLFLAVLKTPSNSVNALLEKLGEARFAVLAEAASRQSDDRHPIVDTPTPGSILQ